MPRKSKPWWWSERSCWATTLAGKRHRAPADVVTEHDAWAWHAALIAETTPKLVSRATLTIGDVLDAYALWDSEGVKDGTRNGVTATNVLGCIQTIANTKLGTKTFGNMLAARVTADHYDALILAWRKVPYKPNYIAALATKLKTILRWAARPTPARAALIDSTPFKDCSAPATQSGGERYGDRDTAARWLRFLWGEKGDKRLRGDALFQRCLVHTGARPSELAWATWGEVKWDAMRDSVGNPMAIISRREWKNAKKTGKTRRIFFPSRLVRAMKRRSIGKRPDELIFPRPTGGRHTSQGVSNRTVWMRKKAKAMGIVLVERNGKDVTNYLWRHTAASTLLMNGVDVATVAELLGTGIDQIQRTYGHLLADHLALASEKLGRRRLTGS